jgi:hypothetical protein
VLRNIDQPDDLLDDEVGQNHLQSRKSAMTAVPDFDPDAFLIVPARTFEDLRIGEVFRAPQPHPDGRPCRGLPDGLYGPGATLFPHFIGEVFISSLELSCTFVAEVHSGDTLYPALTITGLEPKGDDGIVVTAVTVHNQRGQLVLSGQHKYLLRRQRAVPNGDG